MGSFGIPMTQQLAIFKVMYGKPRKQKKCLNHPNSPWKLLPFADFYRQCREGRKRGEPCREM